MVGRGDDYAPPVKLWTTKAERERWDAQADLYAIILTTEKLDKAFLRSAIPAADYERECLGLIAKFKSLRSALASTVPDVEAFMLAHRLECPAAKHRLLVAGTPMTTEHGAARPEGAGSSVCVAQTTQVFITAMDQIKLQMVAVDQVFPYLQAGQRGTKNVVANTTAHINALTPRCRRTCWRTFGRYRSFRGSLRGRKR